MQIGLIGLGKMGYNLALNMRDRGFEVFAFDVSAETVAKITAEEQIKGFTNLADLCAALPAPRHLWLMVPAGPTVDQVIEQLLPHLQADDLLIDGGNSHFKESLRRHEQVAQHQIHYLDCGTSGGTSGARNGACTMVGGSKEAFARCEALFKAISIPEGYLHCGPAGSGHFAKMVHNGIEYGMMQAIAEGFEVLEKSGMDYDFEQVARLWDRGSVIRGWLMELTGNAFSKDPHLDGIRGVMHSSGEGKWTLETALDLGVPTPVIAMSLIMRQRSLQEDTFAGKIVAALRNEFGGHAVEKK
jgi:6-phosphogluconate dehydrogenase